MLTKERIAFLHHDLCDVGFLHACYAQELFTEVERLQEENSELSDGWSHAKKELEIALSCQPTLLADYKELAAYRAIGEVEKVKRIYCAAVRYADKLQGLPGIDMYGEDVRRAVYPVMSKLSTAGRAALELLNKELGYAR